jgi:hypothetical protein
MTKKRKLSLEYVPEFTAIGVFTSQKYYRFCWFLNKHLNLDFRRLPDFLYKPYKQTESSPFPLFFHETPQLLLQYFLIVNKTSAGILFDQPQNLDLLLLLKNSGGQADPAQIIHNIKKIPMVQAAFLLDDKLGKRATNIFYDLEMHFGSLPGTS